MNNSRMVASPGLLAIIQLDDHACRPAFKCTSLCGLRPPQPNIKGPRRINARGLLTFKGTKKHNAPISREIGRMGEPPCPALLLDGCR